MFSFDGNHFCSASKVTKRFGFIALEDSKQLYLINNLILTVFVYHLFINFHLYSLSQFIILLFSLLIYEHNIFFHMCTFYFV